ncbi:6658_t:CDS:2 [Ambispora gerdemannii]|uniref:6658_t:CDS:1 n=1 Tax=Ambispora gerdemannii TaxID=144530 RepID=A0A9N8VA35_9GLOM|nr:6658_t:CDS:2 [Ambispora gerdemannii]
MYPSVVGLLVSDFDETITQNDTLSVLIAICPRMSDDCRKDCPPPWSYFVELYFKERAEHIKRWGETNSERTLEDFYKLLKSLENVEERSMKRVEDFKCLVGVRSEELREQGKKIKKQPGAVDVIERYLVKNKPGSFYVISTNWSHDMLFGCLQEIDGIDEKIIISNDFVFEENCSTGKFKRKVLTALDKLEIFKQLTVPRDKISVYVGDSETDLPCMLAADIGIIMGNNVSLAQSCKKYGIEIIEGLQSAYPKNSISKKRLFRVKDWIEIGKSELF